MDAGLGNFSGQSWPYLFQCLCLRLSSLAQANWTQAVDKDSCVADQAAAVSYSEVSCAALSPHCLHNTMTHLVPGICTSNGGTHVRDSQQYVHP